MRLLGLGIVVPGQLALESGHGPLMTFQRMEGPPQLRHPEREPDKHYYPTTSVH